MVALENVMLGQYPTYRAAPAVAFAFRLPPARRAESARAPMRWRCWIDSTAERSPATLSGPAV